jgi:hypothetical protein
MFFLKPLTAYHKRKKDLRNHSLTTITFLIKTCMCSCFSRQKNHHSAPWTSALSASYYSFFLSFSHPYLKRWKHMNFKLNLFAMQLFNKRIIARFKYNMSTKLTYHESVSLSIYYSQQKKKFSHMFTPSTSNDYTLISIEMKNQ